MRGAHRGVWCSKVSSLMEAELFAAERGRPALSGRALSCAADNAREIQGITASHKRNNARNRAPVTPVSLRDRRESHPKERLGSQEGQGNLGVPAPFVSAGRPRHPRPPKAAIVHAHLERKVASSGAPLYRRNRLPSAEGKERRTLVASDGENQAFFACLRSTADFTISMPIRHTTPISTMVPPGFSPP